jgi:EmrB/QacA subfamily drug resistance transporter
MLAPLNSTMIAVAMPEIIDQFNSNIGTASWLVTAYLISMAALQPLGGKLGDTFGRRRLVLGGMMGFALSSLGAALAPSLWPLIGFRVLQAASAAIMVPNTSAIVRELVPEHRRARTFGLLGAAIAVAAAAGPPVGGFIVEFAGWRSIFAVNIFLLVPALALAWRSLPQSEIPDAGRKIDLMGAVLLPATLVGATSVLIGVGRGVPFVPLAIGGLATIIAGIFLIRQELVHPDPVFQPRLYKVRSFSAACAGIGLGNLSMYTLLISVPLLLTSRDGSSALESGLVLAALSVAMIVLSPAGGALADRHGRRVPAVIGLALVAIGAAPISVSGGGITLAPLLAGLALIGLGIGLSTPGLQTSAVEAVPAAQAGSASGLYATSRYFGSITGSALLASFLTSDAPNPEGIGAVFTIVLISAILATVAALFLRPFPPSLK